MGIVTYQRDGRSPIPENETISRVMSANRGKDTLPEVALRKALWGAGLRGYRTNVPNLKGRPDIVFRRRKIAIFVHGCFWHRCPFCKLSLPKTNHAFWRNKFKNNIARDKKNVVHLRKDGWQVIVIRECQLEKNAAATIRKIANLYAHRPLDI